MKKKMLFCTAITLVILLLLCSCQKKDVPLDHVTALFESDIELSISQAYNDRVDDGKYHRADAYVVIILRPHDTINIESITVDVSVDATFWSVDGDSEIELGYSGNGEWIGTAYLSAESRLINTPFDHLFSSDFTVTVHHVTGTMN